MSWVTVIWSMTASACLTLAMIHGFIWWRQRTAWANLAFMVTAISTAAFAACEVAMMQAQNVGEYGHDLRWTHVPVLLIVVSVVLFVKVYCQAGRPWLMWTACGLRAISLVLNFTTGVSLNYQRITSLRHSNILGDPIAIADGVPNPWMVVGNLSLLLVMIFVADATITVWKRGERRLAASVGGSILVFSVGGTAQALAVFWFHAPWPITSSLFYLGIVVAMSYQLGGEALNAARLARDLRESEQRMTLAAEATNLGIWVRDLVQQTVWASERWRALFAIPAGAPITFDRFVERLHPDDRDATRRALEAGTRLGTYEVEYRIALPDGRTRWVASRGRARFDAAGRATRVWDVSQDITHRKHAEAELLSQQDRTAHLLRVASLGELSSALAHELNQPLMAIMSNAQAAQRFLAKDTPDLNEIRDILNDIVADDERASQVIRRLRTLMKRGESRPVSLSVEALIEDVLKLMNGDLSARGVTVAREFACELPLVTGDPVQLQQVLINLVLNAADAMQATAADRRTLTLRSACEDGFVTLAVIDTGAGVPAGEEEKIFEPYHTTKYHGLGLGLSLSRSIAAAHGGRLWAGRQPGGGMVFSLTIPEVRGGLQ